MCNYGASLPEVGHEPCECYEKGYRAAALEFYTRIQTFARDQVGILDAREEHPPLRVLYSPYKPKSSADYMALWGELRIVQPSLYDLVIRHLAMTPVSADEFILDPQAKASLVAAKFYTVLDVHRKTNKQLLAVKGIGKHWLYEIRAAIWRHGMATSHAFDQTKGERYAHPIEFLQLTEPEVRVLKMHNIISVGDLARLSDEELRAMSGDWRRETVARMRRRLHVCLTM